MPSLTDLKILNQNTFPGGISLYLCIVSFRYSPERIFKEVRQYSGQHTKRFYF